METLALTVCLLLVTTLGGLVLLKLHRDNRELRGRFDGIEQKISTSVEERLVNHAKYCEKVDALVQKQLEAEENKWRELIVAATCRIKGVINAGHKEMSAKQEADMTEITHALEKQMTNFKALLNQSYLDEYEKMRYNPPRPKKGPRKKIDPPQRYRSLDDEFNCTPTEAEKE